MARNSSFRRGWLILLLLALLLGLGGLQVWTAVATRDVVTEALAAAGPAGAADVEREKARQELIGKEIENKSKALLQTNLVGALGAGLGLIISVSGGLVALFSYFDARDKDREDKAAADRRARADRLAAEDKARGDRLAATLGETLGRLASTEPRQRAVGAAGLLPFFTAERGEFHLQALAALAALAKTEGEPREVHEGVRVALEQALRVVSPERTAKLSWRRAQLGQIDLAGCDLSGLDFRDAILTDARLEGASFARCDLTAAKLQGAALARADLTSANLTYADLAGADLKGATLAGATIESAGVLNVDLEGADLTGLAAGWRSVPWDATRNWRRARFALAVRAELDAVYGAEVPPLRVLMLLWEVPPFVAGGSWTAAYHLVRRLRRRGADVTIVTPWKRDLLVDNPFGLDVAVVGLGITPPRDPGPGGYGAYGAYSTYGVYGAGRGAGGVYGPYGVYGLPGLLGSVLNVLMSEYRAGLAAYVAERRFDLIHAHDWVTFDAARVASEASGAPWVAHFHSTEADRNPEAPDLLTAATERMAVDKAAGVATPSEVTRRRLAEVYGAPPDGIVVVPNVLSEEAVSAEDTGGFEGRRVVFVGRLTPQKGVDRFGEVAQEVRGSAYGVSFEVVGDGEGAELAARYGLRLRGALPWARRGEAFRSASVVVMPSRFEPFGMVALEAMQHRVPILYPRASGAAEVLESGVKVDAADIGAMSQEVLRLLADATHWETTVRAQATEIEAYPRRDYEDRLIDLWVRVAAKAGAAQ